MRLRLTVTVCLLVAVTLAVAGLLLYAIQSQRINEQVTNAVEQELGEFRKLRQGDDPATSKPFTSSDELFRSFMERNVPDNDELLIGWVDGDLALHSPPSGAPKETAVAEAIRRHLDDGGSERVHTDKYGELLVTVQPVSFRSEAGTPHDALVIVTFLDETRQDLRSTMGTYTAIAALLLITVTGVAWWRSGRLLAPLRDLRETAADITTRDLARRLPERGNDDITALTRTFNDMLDRLEHGVATQRQFLDDAGHELKTPLTVLRGHLELLDVGDEDEIDQTRELLLDEVDRMSRLVGDLIMLTKSRRPDFLSPGPVDLAELTDDLLAKSRGLGPRTWVLDNSAAGIVTLDEQRITQAMLQLADNAVKHTDEGDQIGLGSDLVDDADAPSVRLWVRDTGDGVPTEDRERIFDRFGRSAVRGGDEGFGLGLSIVRAIAQAHDGGVELLPQDQDRAGAWFVITLPQTEPDEGDQWPAS